VPPFATPSHAVPLAPSNGKTCVLKLLVIGRARELFSFSYLRLEPSVLLLTVGDMRHELVVSLAFSML